MSLTEIEAELEKLTPDELRRLALKSWRQFVEREAQPSAGNECSEADPELLASLDEAIAQADAAPDRNYSGEEVRTRIGEWTSTS